MDREKFWEVIIPAILAGVVAGFGSFVAVKTDIAVLKANQEEFKKVLAVVQELQKDDVRHEDRLDFLQYQIDNAESKSLAKL